MISTRLVGILVAALSVSPLYAQTHAERLERAIFTEDTLGDLPIAMQIYDDLARRQGVPREIAAVAEARLAAGVRRQAELGHAEAVRGRAVHVELPDARARRTARAGGAAAPVRQAMEGCCGMFSGHYDAARAVTISGVVTKMEWVNPHAVIYVKGSDGNLWGFTMDPPNFMIRVGMSKSSVTPGEQVLVYGYLATGAGDECPGVLPNSCQTLLNGAFHASASTITSADNRSIYDRLDLQMRHRQLQPDQQNQR